MFPLGIVYNGVCIERYIESVSLPEDLCLGIFADYIVSKSYLLGPHAVGTPLIAEINRMW